MWENHDCEEEALGPDAADYDIEGLGPPLASNRSRFAWDSERNCRYLAEADLCDEEEDEEYEDQGG